MAGWGLGRLGWGRWGWDEAGVEAGLIPRFAWGGWQ